MDTVGSQEPNGWAPLFVLITIVILVVVSYLSYRRYLRITKETTTKLIEKRPERLVNIMWRPVQEELSQVVAENGAVTNGGSVWNQVEFFAKRESGPKFQDGMDQYVNQRTTVATMSSNPTDSGSNLEAEKQTLVALSEDLLIQTRSAILREAEQVFR